jgi:hypothetical protein
MMHRMHPVTIELLEHLDRTRAVLRDAVDAVSPPLRERRPAPERWSVAEIVEHLSLVESRLAQRIAALPIAAPAEPTPPSRPGALVGSIDVARVLDRGRTVVAADAVHPHPGCTFDFAWSALEESRQRLRDAVLARDGIPAGDARFPHPALGTLDIHQWVVFAGYHEERHAAQIRDVAAALLAAG